MKSVTLPREMSPELAEEIGIHIGDGSLVIRPKYHHYDYFVCLGIHEQEYMQYVCKLMHRLYSLKGKITERQKDGALTATFSSKSLIMWKLSLGLPSGNKGQISIPKVVLDSEYILDCIRGIFDTDGSLTFKKKYRDVHYYPVVKIDSKSKFLILQLLEVISKFGFTCYAFYDGKHKSSTGVTTTVHSLFISGQKSLELWMDLIRPKNPVHISKYMIWKKFGFCPPRTTLSTRKSILEGRKAAISYENVGGEI